MNIATTMSKQEKKWRAEEDARTLARTKEIQSDPVRMKAAATAAKSVIKDKQSYIEEMKQELSGLQKIAKKAK